MAITEATLEATVELLAAAIGDEDYAEAVKQLRKARAYLIALPNSTVDGVQTQYRDQVEALAAELQNAKTEASASRGRRRVAKLI